MHKHSQISGIFVSRALKLSDKQSRNPRVLPFAASSDNLNSFRNFLFKKIRGLIPAKLNVSQELVSLESVAAVCKLISDLQATQS